MKAEKVISYLLNNAAPVTTIVGERIYGGSARKGAIAPLVVYGKQGAERDPDLDATETTVTARMDVMCVAKTYPQLKELAEAIRVALSFKSGTLAGVNCLEVREPEEGPDEYDPELDEYAQVWNFTVVHTE